MTPERCHGQAICVMIRLFYIMDRSMYIRGDHRVTYVRRSGAITAIVIDRRRFRHCIE